MKRGGTLLVAVLLGFTAGLLLPWDPGSTPLRTLPPEPGARAQGADATPDVIPLARAPAPGAALEGRAGPAKPKVRISAGGGGVAVSNAGDLSAAIHEVQQAFRDRFADQAKQIKRLTAERDRLQATLPKPELLDALERAETEELVLLASEVRREATHRLLTPSESVVGLYPELADRTDAGIARILPGGRFEQLIEPRGGGAFWSFVKRSNDYNDEPDLDLSKGWYSTSFYGGTSGYLMDLGRRALEDIAADVSRPPADSSPAALEQWQYLWTAATRTEAGRYGLHAPAPDPPLTDRIRAVVGHTYLVRAILPGEHDVLVAFHAVEADAFGQTLAWKILKQWPKPARR